MTNEFVAVHADFTAQQAIEEIRTDAADVETIYYIYVIAKDETLVGVISLRNLLLALPVDKLSSFMRTDVITVQLTDDQRDVAKKIAKYNLLALPVVDEEKKLKGIVTVDDAIDVVLPTAWKKRFRTAPGRRGASLLLISGSSWHFKSPWLSDSPFCQARSVAAISAFGHIISASTQAAMARTTTHPLAVAQFGDA